MENKISREDMVQIKEKLLIMLREKPMYRKDIQSVFGLTKVQVNNALTRMKDYGLIDIYHEDKNNQKNDPVRWFKTDKTCSYKDCVIDGQKNIIGISSNKNKSEQYSPFATMKVTNNDYKTKGCYEKRSAWSGYTSMEFM